MYARGPVFPNTDWESDGCGLVPERTSEDTGEIGRSLVEFSSFPQKNPKEVLGRATFGLILKTLLAERNHDNAPTSQLVSAN